LHLSDLIKGIDGLTAAGAVADTVVSAVSADSRSVQKGTVFAAIKGDNHDGHDFIPGAIDSGAIAILSEKKQLKLPKGICHLRSANPRSDYARLCNRFYHGRPGMLVGITGTNGKTSCAEYLRQIWARATWPAATIGTLGIVCPDPGLASGASNLTTPPAEQFFSLLDSLAKSGVTHTAFEASSHGLAQGRLGDMGVNVALFTNLSRDHLDWHGDMDSYFAAKSKLFTAHLLNGGTAILNADDERVIQLKDQLAEREIVIWTVGMNAAADFHIRAIERQPFGLDVRISAQGHDFTVPLALSGTFQAVNAVMAAVAAYASGMPLQDSFGALPALRPVRGRMQPVHGHPQGARIIIDFAHTPDALESALDALRAQTPGALHVLFGCGGDRDRGKRPQMGAVACRLADKVIISDDNPRSEDPAAIRAEIRAACPQAIELAPREQAIKSAIGGLGSDDTLLIAGKGHESVQMIGTETLPFDDASVARHFLSQLDSQERR